MLPASRTDQTLLALSDHISPFQLWAFWDLPSALDEPRLRRAMDRLVTRIPVLGCRLETRFWRDRWAPLDSLAPGDDLVSTAALADAAELEAASAEVVASFLDVRTGPALRLHHLAHPGGARLIMHLHHCLVDGRSLVRVMDELARCYRRLGRAPDWRPATPLPLGRSAGPIFRGLALRHWLRLPFSFVAQNARLLLARSRCASFAMDREVAITGELGVARNFAVTIREPLVPGLLDWCRARAVTLNDYLVTATIIALDQWNGPGALDRARELLPLLFAADLRPPFAPGHAPIANIAALQNLLVPRSAVDDFPATLPRIKRRIDHFKRRGVGLDALFALGMILPLPAALFRLAAPLFLKLWGRVVLQLNGFTNIGVIPDDAGRFDDGLVADRCSILASIFPVNTMLFTVTTYRDQLTVQLGYDGRGLSEAGAGRFGALLEETIRAAASN